MNVFYIVVDSRDVSKLSKLTVSHEWQLHSKHAEIFDTMQKNDLVLFSKQSRYSWDAILQVKEKQILEIKNNNAKQFREKNKILSVQFKNKNFLSKYQNSFDVPGLSKLRPGAYHLKSTLSAKKPKQHHNS